jgi:hypothetical protein
MITNFFQAIQVTTLLESKMVLRRSYFVEDGRITNLFKSVGLVGIGIDAAVVTTSRWIRDLSGGQGPGAQS